MDKSSAIKMGAVALVLTGCVAGYLLFGVDYRRAAISDCAWQTLRAYGFSEQIAGAVVERAMTEANTHNIDLMLVNCQKTLESSDQVLADNPMMVMGVAMANTMAASNPNMLDAMMASVFGPQQQSGVATSDQHVSGADDQTAEFGRALLDGFDALTAEADLTPAAATEPEPVPQTASDPAPEPQPLREPEPSAQPKSAFTASFVRAPMSASAIEPVAEVMRSSGTNQCDLAQPYAYTDPKSGEVRAMDGALLVCTDANGVGIFLAASGGRVFMNDLTQAPAVFEAAYGWRVKSFDIGQERVSMLVED